MGKSVEKIPQIDYKGRQKLSAEVFRRALEDKKMLKLINKKAKTPSQKIVNRNAFTREDVLALLNALHPSDTYQPLETETQGIVVKPAAKPATKLVAKPTQRVPATVEFSDDGKYAMLRLTGSDGRDFAFGMRKAREILANIDAIREFVAEYGPLQDTPLK